MGGEYILDKNENNNSDKISEECECHDKDSDDIVLEKYDKNLIKTFMRGFGKTIILGMIKKRRLHGYEVMTTINKFYLSHNISKKMKPLGPSTVYPVLHDLEKRGLIKGTWEHQGKRKLKYYEITPEGEATIIRIREIFENNIAKLWEDFWNDDIYLGDELED